MSSAEEQQQEEEQEQGQEAPREIVLYCHQCRILVSTAAADEIQCPRCHGGFVEERDDDPLLSDLAAFRTTAAPPTFQNSRNTISLLTNLMRQREITGGLDFVLDTEEEDRGDSLLGADFENIMFQLAAESEANSTQGSRRASKAAVEGLPTLKMSEEHLVGEDHPSCAVCKEEFAVGVEVKQMPCKHMYHPDCILPWLSHHNSCPLCRFELESEVAAPGGRVSAARGDLRRMFQGNADMLLRQFYFPFARRSDPSGSRLQEAYDSLTDVD